MPPAVVPFVPLIAGGLGAAATVFSSQQASRSAASAQRANQATNALSQANFDQQMDHTVARRVADAQRAGISPLAALGVSHSPAPNFIPHQQRVGGTLNPFEMMGDVLQSYGRASAARQRRQTAQINRTREADRARIMAVTDNIKMQTALARQRLAERQLSLHMQSAVAEHQSKQAPGRRRPMFIPVYDNRDGEQLGKGEYWVLDSEIAEGMEGALPAAVTAAGNVEPVVRSGLATMRDNLGPAPSRRSGMDEPMAMP